MVKGYRDFDADLPLAGIILNRVSERHAQLLRESLRAAVDVPVLGYLPAEPAVAIPERHLGLVPAQEATALTERMDRLARLIETTVDLERVARIARGAPALPDVPPPWRAAPARSPAVRLGIAKDRAFHFYYQDNLDLLSASGAELVEFSPLDDPRLPDALDALYLGGGFPELFASQLARNEPLRRHIKEAVAGGLPTYAECGGLMYLAQRLVGLDGRSHPMAGVLPGTIHMTPRLQSFGYATLISRRPTILAGAQERIKGHEFHYSRWDHPVSTREAAYTVRRRNDPRRLEGFVRGPLLASYIHVHFLTNVRWAQGFIASARRWRQRHHRRGGG